MALVGDIVARAGEEAAVGHLELGLDGVPVVDGVVCDLGGADADLGQRGAEAVRKGLTSDLLGVIGQPAPGWQLQVGIHYEAAGGERHASLPPLEVLHRFVVQPRDVGEVTDEALRDAPLLGVRERHEVYVADTEAEPSHAPRRPSHSPGVSGQGPHGRRAMKVAGAFPAPEGEVGATRHSGASRLARADGGLVALLLLLHAGGVCHAVEGAVRHLLAPVRVVVGGLVARQRRTEHGLRDTPPERRLWLHVLLGVSDLHTGAAFHVVPQGAPAENVD
mmetsp:Transcript_76843/g.237338  ORF Transcript_76843/g.237338 Transcript_76843/m.237338 type:complete len:277 (-) Transcript_76843:121-951(-)